jgi:hypothetical protein
MSIELTSLPLGAFEFEPSARPAAHQFLDGPLATVFTRFLRDQESPAVLLAARRLLHAFLPGAPAAPDDAHPDEITERVATARRDLVGRFIALDPPKDLAWRQRAPLALIAGCWLDAASQPATQPAPIANLLLRQHIVLKGSGNPVRSLHRLRRTALEQGGTYLPEVGAADFPAATGATDLTLWHALAYLALSRLPAAFLPEVVGVHYAYHALAVDDLVLGTTSPLDTSTVDSMLSAYLRMCDDSPTGDADRRRLTAAVNLVIRLEDEWMRTLADLTGWRANRPLPDRVAEIVARHAPYAGRQHHGIRVAGRDLVDTFADPGFDATAFLPELARSPHLRRRPDGGCRFLDAIRFGGPMFGIFDDAEAAVLAAWVAQVQDGTAPPPGDDRCTAGDEDAARWAAALALGDPPDVCYRPAQVRDDRDLFHRLVNIERYANTLELARQRAERGFADGEVLFAVGAAGRYTDASFFEYEPDALVRRVEAIYWDKLVDPYRPLEEVPDREQVVFNQTTLALGSLVDGAWLYRIGNLGRYDRRCDGILFGIYADEMGYGDLRKNHLALIGQVLASMAVHLPHIREADFIDQEQLPEGGYDFAIHQLCMSLFPDSFFPEIVGYNLAIEMYGLGELRLHEIQKLRRHGFDTAYEEVHLSIDNLSAGHSRQAVDVILTYLDEIGRQHGEPAVDAHWRRIWRGYAAFAFFAEHRLLGEQALQPPAPVPAGDDEVELLL